MTLFKKLKKRFTFFAYNLESQEYLDNFLISAILSIIVIRLFLYLTGYPQLGGGGLHVAHMLWGGALMAIAIIMMLMFLNKEARHVGAIIGGVGFGVFIDELGKFITSDNNYFFQPTFALLYIIFVLMFLGFRYLRHKFPLDEQDYTINAIELIKETVFHNLDEHEKKRALVYLKKADRKSYLVHELEKVLTKTQASADDEVQIVAKIKKQLTLVYLSIVRREWFAWGIAIIFSIVAVLNIIWVFLYLQPENITFWSLGAQVSSFISGVIAAIGIYHLFRKKRLLGFRNLKASVLVYIFLGHFFAFYYHQLLASLSLIVAVSIYISLQFLVEQEKFYGNY